MLNERNYKLNDSISNLRLKTEYHLVFVHQEAYAH